METPPPGQTRPGQPRPGRREDILAAATALFGQHGVHAVSTRQIAARVGISQPSLYAHFASVQDIEAEVSTRAFALLEARFAGNEKATPQDQLRHAIAGYVDFGLTNPEAYRIAFMREHPKPAADAAHTPAGKDTRDPAAFAALDHPGPRAFGHLRRAIVRLRPDLTPDGLNLSSQCLWATLHGLVALLIARPDFPWAPRDRLIAEQSRLAYQMIVT